VTCIDVVEQMEAQSLSVERLVNILCQEGYNKQGANLRQPHSYSSFKFPKRKTVA
jgi:hypothetical protein